MSKNPENLTPPVEIKKNEMEFNEEDNKVVEKFVDDNLELFPDTEKQAFKDLVEHLKKIQKPLRVKSGDSILHGISVANFSKEFGSAIKKETLLAMLGHDWDRACGDLAIKQEDFTKDRYNEYKEEHARNSANLFVRELEKFFDDKKLAKQVHDLILIHEKGGTPEADLINFADAVALLKPSAAQWYRHEKKYKDKNKKTLSGDELEQVRKVGFADKVKFMVKDLKPEQFDLAKGYVEKNLGNYSPEIQQVLKDYFEI